MQLSQLMSVLEINTKPAVKTPEEVLLHNFGMLNSIMILIILIVVLELQYEPAVWGNEPVESEAELRARLFFPLNQSAPLIQTAP